MEISSGNTKLEPNLFVMSRGRCSFISGITVNILSDYFAHMNSSYRQHGPRRVSDSAKTTG